MGGVRRGGGRPYPQNVDKSHVFFLLLTNHLSHLNENKSKAIILQIFCLKRFLNSEHHDLVAELVLGFTNINLLVKLVQA